MEDEGDRTMFRFAAAGVVLFLIVVLGAWLALTRPDGVRTIAKDPPKPAPTHVTAAAPVETPPGDCNVPDGPQTLAAPDDVKWELYEGAALPSSATAGPLTTEGVVARCYARSPGGSLLAAIQIEAHLGLSGNVKWEDVAMAQLAPGAGRDIWIRRARQLIAAAPPGQPGTAPNRVAAFKFVSYTPSAAVVAIVYRTDSGSLGVGYKTVVWDSGDWKLAVQPDGSLGPPAAAIPSIIGFNEFRGA
jgi:hypothetical protein